MAMNGYEEVASVKFIEGTNTTKVYHFTLYDRVVEVGDYALVKSNNGYGSGNYGVVKVVGIEPTARSFWLIRPSPIPTMRWSSCLQLTAKLSAPNPMKARVVNGYERICCDPRF